MLDVIFRTCLASETSNVQELVDDLYRAYPGVDGVEPDIALTVAEFERHPEKGRVIVFELNGQPVGYAILVFFWSNEFRGDVIEIDELFIDNRNRGRGIGSWFFAWLESSYPESVALALQVSETNTAAARFYERAGFRASLNRHLFKLLRLGISEELD